VNQNVLTRILDQKREEVSLLANKAPLADLRAQAEDTAPARDFLAALRARPGHAVIAEIKRASPSAGRLAIAVDPAERAKLYEASGAAALSVLTDTVFFGGSLQDMRLAREACGLPVLRKDFVISINQIYEARAAGADAVLLIAAALEQEQMTDLYACVRELDMTPLVEVHSQDELDAVLGLSPELVGINNRNLKSMKIDLSTSLELRPLIPPNVTVVAESGVSSPEDVARLREGGLDAFLVGTSLMKADDPAAVLRSLVNDHGGRP
jgi:indole-3-glycerol phosphate synthase